LNSGCGFPKRRKHAGAISQGNRFRDTTVGPSAIQPKGKQMTSYYGKDTYAVPRPISDEQIAEAIAGFGTSAARAVGIAGFDAIEIHGANGYLLDQFLTDYTDTRSDRWGGSVRERIGLSGNGCRSGSGNNFSSKLIQTRSTSRLAELELLNTSMVEDDGRS
jgi:hypothetical protein